jgi:hypothetical protein
MSSSTHSTMSQASVSKRLRNSLSVYILLVTNCLLWFLG